MIEQSKRDKVIGDTLVKLGVVSKDELKEINQLPVPKEGSMKVYEVIKNQKVICKVTNPEKAITEGTLASFYAAAMFVDFFDIDEVRVRDL